MPITSGDQAVSGTMPTVACIVLVAHDTDRLGRSHAAIAAALADAGHAAEFVYAVSDRCPRALAALAHLEAAGRPLAVVLLTHWFDRAAAIQRALPLTTGEAVLVLPGAGDVEPVDLPRMIAALGERDVVLARRGRGGGRPARGVDRLARHLFDAPLADPSAGTRAWRRAALEAVGDRSVPCGLTPLLASWLGLAVDEVGVRAPAERPRRRVPVPTLGYLVGVPFLYLLLSFAKRPLQLFGAVGAAAFAAGLAIILPLASARLVFGQPVADEPALMPGLLLIALGVQCGALGLLAELLVFARNRAIKDYVVERMVE